MSVPEPRQCPIASRVDIAWACVAANDPHPLHLDHTFAVGQAGYRDVVAPATMLIGWIGEYLEDWAGGLENLLDWRVRFTAPVWPDDRITLTGKIDHADKAADGRIAASVIATTEDDRIVGVASAEIAAAK